MGIDIYARWKGMTKEEERAQITGFDPCKGEAGYLREAYHGEPYATHYLVKEAFASKTGKAKIPAKVLRERLPTTLGMVQIREIVIYKSSKKRIAQVRQSFKRFVFLCEKKEKETGKPVTIIASF